MFRKCFSGLALVLAGCVTVPASDGAKTVPQSAAMEAQSASTAAAIHRRLLTLDTHLDTPALLLRDGWSIDVEHAVSHDGSDVDLPRMRRGGLDGGFWAVYTRQGPRTEEGYAKASEHALRTAAAIRKMVESRPRSFALALKADDAAKIAASGKRIVFMSIENSFPLGKDPSALKTYYDLGVRMAGPVHMSNNDLADSSTDPKGPEWNGLSPLGREFVAEANRLGIILDASHASDATFDQMLELSKAPIILSHSGVKALYDHPRNIDDERLKRLAAKGGVIQMNTLSAYLIPTPRNLERETALAAMYARYDLAHMSAAQGVALTKARAKIDKEFPIPRATFEDFMAQVLHALKLVGPDHVGIGADWDGGGGVTGMEDVAKIGRITERLLMEGYSEQDLEKIWGGNVLRVMRAVEVESAKEASQ